MSGSMFRRVTRYPVGASVNPRENRLTEVTAAVFDLVHGVAAAFIAAVLQAGIEDALRRDLGPAELARREGVLADFNSIENPRASVRTQLATSRGRFVDVELLVRPAVGARGKGLLLWVEVKRGAGLHGDQLDAYLAQIPERLVADTVERVVVLLAPRGWDSGGAAVPTNVLIAYWQDITRIVRALSTDADHPEQRWLLNEYTRYLQEEALSDPDALTAASALALMEYRSAREAAAGICEHADTVIIRDWSPRRDHRKTIGKTPAPAYGLDYWAHHDAHRKGDPSSPTWRGAWFEWGLRDTSRMDGLDATRGAWAFIAGVTFNKENPTKVAQNDAWLARRAADGFVQFWHSGYYRLCRLRYPDELLKDTVLEE